MDMELDLKLKTMTCRSCSSQCQIKPVISTRFNYCISSCFCMWPEENIYFHQGVVEGILSRNHNSRQKGFIFVDFSISFLHLYLNDNWIRYLSDTEMGIVLLCDRNMQALANYWLKNTQYISAVIYQNENLQTVNDKIKQVFIGRNILIRKGNTLTATEFNILSGLVSGRSYLQVACELNMDIRSVYAYKQRIEKRMGSKLNALFIHVHPDMKLVAAHPLAINEQQTQHKECSDSDPLLEIS